jgi:hypothetical protein
VGGEPRYTLDPGARATAPDSSLGTVNGMAATSEELDTSATLPVQLDHLSDTHLGFQQYPIRSGRGRNQRDQDFSRAFLEVVTDIAEADNALIIHSGDFFDNSRPTWRHVLQAQTGIEKLTENGRILVIAGGNHDQPADANEPCSLELFRNMPGVYVATNKYAVIDLSDDVKAGRGRPELDKLVIHLLPHEALKSTDWDEVQPIEGRRNILVSHCVVGGTALYRRSIGREYSLPIDVITRGWDYVALGHYHKQGPVAVGGFSDSTTPAWYAGSTENNGFSDVRDSKSGGARGYLRVRLTPGQKVPQVNPVDLPIRAMFRLPVIDATGMDADAVTAQMLKNVTEAKIDGAVVRQVINGLHRDTWGLVDIAAVRAAASAGLWYEAKPEFASTDLVGALDENGEPVEGSRSMDDLSAILGDVLEDLYAKDPHKDGIGQYAAKLLGDSLKPVVLEESCCAHQDSEHEHHEAPAEPVTEVVA